MTSTVLVKLPVVPFSQRKKPPPEIISLPNRNDENDEGRFQGPDKVTQLEQNMIFLQEQHKITLAALHQEVEILRQRNRDLQFQLVFSKGSNSTSSSPSSPEENANGFVKPKQGSPANINVTPLQVELLEKDLQDLKISLNEAKKRNIYLSEVIEKQKKSLELVEKTKERSKSSDMGVQVDGMLECSQVELQARLDDAEALVKRLRLESDEQRKEIASLRSRSAGSSSRGSGGAARGSQNPSAYHSRQTEAQHHHQPEQENYHKFPPLQTQSYWHHRPSRPNHSHYDHSSQSDQYHRNGRHHQDRQDLETDVDNTVLPQLRNGSVRVDNSSSYPPFFRSRGGGHHSGSYYNKDDRGNRKYRGQKPQRDRDYQPKDNQQQQHRQHRDFTESARGSTRNLQRQ